MNNNKIHRMPGFNSRLYELQEAFLSQKLKNSMRCMNLRKMFSGIISFSFGDAAARVYGEFRFFLARAGTPIGPNDLMIASIALAHKADLVTHNTKEFRKVPHLVD